MAISFISKIEIKEGEQIVSSDLREGQKIDHVLVHQNKKLLEIQQIQADYLEDLINELKNKH